MVPGNQEDWQVEKGQALFIRTPVSDDTHAAPLAAWVAWGVGRQQCRWSGGHSAHMDRSKAIGISIQIRQQPLHILK
jgi:hypothetical protein